MTGSFRAWMVGMIAAVMVIIVPVGISWACVGLVSLTTDSATVQPGGTVLVIGKEFASGSPVHIHLDSLDGPVLATAPAPTSTMTSKFTIPVTIPANVEDGRHVLIAWQNHHGMNGGIPARAVIYAGTAPPAPPALPERPAAVVTESGLSAGTLALIGAAVAVGALFLATVVLTVVRRAGSRVQQGVVTS